MSCEWKASTTEGPALLSTVVFGERRRRIFCPQFRHMSGVLFARPRVDAVAVGRPGPRLLRIHGDIATNGLRAPSSKQYAVRKVPKLAESDACDVWLEAESTALLSPDSLRRARPGGGNQKNEGPRAPRDVYPRGS